MIPGGYILQPRCFDQSDAAALAPVTREVWFFLLRNANHKENGKFKRGQGLFSIPDIQKALEWYVGCCPKQYSKTQVAKALRRLREDAMIATMKTTRGQIITVLNYSTYQDPKSYEDHSEDYTKTPRRTNRDDTINKNVKKKKEKESKTPCADESPRFPFEEHFESFWTHYPKRNGKRVGKGDALAKYKVVVKTEVEADILFDCVMNYADCCQQTDSYPMDAKRWLVAKRWEEYKPGVYEAPVEAQPQESETKRMIRMAQEMEANSGTLRITENN